MKPIPLLLLTLVCIASLTMFFSCNQEKPPAPSVSEISIIDQYFPPTLDPVQEWGSWYLLRYGVAERLLKVSPLGEVVPEIAERIEMIDPNTWELTLRPNTRFWSGEVVDAQAVKASLERSKRLDPSAGPLLQGVAIEVKDQSTLVFITETPNPWFDLNLADFSLVIHNARAYGDDIGETDVQTADLTGPFRITLFEPDNKMVMEAWEGHRDGKPLTDRLILSVMGSGEARVLAAQSGEAEIVGQIPPTSITSIEDSPEMKLMEVHDTVTSAIYMQLSHPILKDLRVRQALELATDRKTLIDVANNGYGRSAASFLSAHPFFPEARKWDASRGNLEGSTALLDLAGWTAEKGAIRRNAQGEPLVLRLVTYGLFKNAGEVLKDQWRSIGVELELQHVDDYGIIQAKINDGDWDLMIESWVRFGNPYSRLASHFLPGMDANYGGYEDQKMNEILEEMRTSSNLETLHKLALKANERVQETVPMINLYTEPRFAAFNKKVTGFEQHFLGEYWVSASISLQK